MDYRLLLIMGRDRTVLAVCVCSTQPLIFIISQDDPLHFKHVTKCFFLHWFHFQISFGMFYICCPWKYVGSELSKWHIQFHMKALYNKPCGSNMREKFRWKNTRTSHSQRFSIVDPTIVIENVFECLCQYYMKINIFLCYSNCSVNSILLDSNWLDWCWRRINASINWNHIISIGIGGTDKSYAYAQHIFT